MPLFSTSVVLMRGSLETASACSPPQLWPPTPMRARSMCPASALPWRAFSRVAQSMASIICETCVSSGVLRAGASGVPGAAGCTSGGATAGAARRLERPFLARLAQRDHDVSLRCDLAQEGGMRQAIVAARAIAPDEKRQWILRQLHRREQRVARQAIDGLRHGRAAVRCPRDFPARRPGPHPATASGELPATQDSRHEACDPWKTPLISLLRGYYGSTAPHCKRLHRRGLGRRVLAHCRRQRGRSYMTGEVHEEG